ncbi:hypothetical protein L2K20_18975 [Mycobacterium sp. MBM]|nr:hypothetical protein [Mycobacterium sp. MBM]
MKIIESLKKWPRADRGWPRYLPGGRIRTSTAGLIAAFIALSWISQNYEPPAPPPAPATQIVPPGFVPDPEYTWVPRTNVEVPRTTYRTTTTTTTTTEPSTTTPTTSPTDPTDTTSPGDSPTSSPVPPPTTTVVDPDGPNGLVPPITLPVVPPPTPQTIATPPPPARSGN